MYITTNDRIINLKNVSNINLLPDSKRIIFNLNYNIEIQTRDGKKLISDYVYWDGFNTEDYLHNLLYLNENDYIAEEFISQHNDVGYINKSAISSLKFSEKKNRVIFNLSHPVTFTNYKGEQKITSEFVYNDCGSIESFNDYSVYIKTQLLGETDGN